MENCFASEHKPDVWQKLGFHSAGYPFVDTPEEMHEDALFLQTVTQFTFLDRIRILISGKVMSSSRVFTNVPVDYAQTFTKTAVLPPNYPRNFGNFNKGE